MKLALAVAVAANMMPVMKEAAPLLKEEGVELVLTQGSSGKLAAQLRHGAPFDVFVSADMEHPRALEKEGLTDGPARLYAFGRLALWTADASGPAALADLKKPEVKKVAVADPRLAPYGRAALEALRAAGVYAAVEKKLVFGESVSQVNHFVASRAADAGLTALSAAQAAGAGRWTLVEPALHAPIEQGFAVMKRAKERSPDAARALSAFLLGPRGRALLERHGYGLPPAAGPKTRR